MFDYLRQPIITLRQRFAGLAFIAVRACYSFVLPLPGTMPIRLWVRPRKWAPAGGSRRTGLLSFRLTRLAAFFFFRAIWDAFAQLLLRLKPVVGVKTFRLTLLRPNLIGTVANWLRFVG